MNSSPLRIGRDRPVASIPSAKDGAINFADARHVFWHVLNATGRLSTPASL
jgi:hypothetical protein